MGKNMRVPAIVNIRVLHPGVLKKGSWLVVEKKKASEKCQLGLLLPIYGKIIQMSQTTNQYIIPGTIVKSPLTTYNWN